MKTILYDRLRHSAMFNLSLSSKELFHSNFLYWIFTVNPKAFKRLIEILLEEQNLAWGSDWRVKREYNHFDLSVVNEKDEFLFVLENKVKSIPVLEQIQKYDEDLSQSPACGKLLLSLVSEFPDKNDIEKVWKVKNYEDLSDALMQIRCMLPIRYVAYIDDYCDFISNLNQLAKEWTKISSNASSNTFIEKEDADLKELRIHDLYGKCKYSVYAVELKKRLKKSGLLVGRRWVVNQGYSNQTPLFEVCIYTDNKDKSNKEAFYVQIQGEQYRHAIEAKGDDDSISGVNGSVAAIKSKSQWTLFMNPDNNGTGVFPSRFSKTKQKKTYCSFKGKEGYNFIYEYRTIPGNITVDKIFNAMEEDVRRIIAILTP